MSSTGGDAGTGGTGEGGTISGGGEGGESGDGSTDTGGTGGSGTNPGGMGGGGTPGGGMAGGGTGGMSGSAGGGGMAGGGGTPPQNELGPHCVSCARQKIGTPAWEPASAIMVVASQSNWNGFANAALTPLHHVDTVQNLVVSSQMHDGPYENEVYDRVVASGRTPTQTFTIQEYTAPSAVAVMMVVVPSAGATTGSSTDFTSGPIIPNSLFPMTCDGDAFRNGVLYDPNFDSVLPGYSQQNPPILKDGPSHMVWLLGENSSFGPPNTPAQGCYEIVYTVIDKSGSGWGIHVPYSVSDTPMPECFP